MPFLVQERANVTSISILDLLFMSIKYTSSQKINAATEMN